MTTMMERVALALANTDRADAGLNALADADQLISLDHYTQRARAALTAIREPDDAMLLSAKSLPDADAYEAWTAIIDAILTEEQS
jgi:hypothetical protein